MASSRHRYWAFHRYQGVIDNIADKNKVAGLRAVAEAALTKSIAALDAVV